MIIYPKQAEELIGLLHIDQNDKRAVGRAFFSQDSDINLDVTRAELKLKTNHRNKRMFQILNEIGEPSISNIGIEAAQAVSVMAVHGSFDDLQKTLTMFTALYTRDRDDTYYQAIPSMTDCILILAHEYQRFGTIWLFDKHKEPFLPPVENFDHVNERRAEFDIEPLRWPISLAIPVSEQPWLKRPLSELLMRKPTETEYHDFAQSFT